MIDLVKLDGVTFYVNPHHIEYISCNPDTTLHMLSGKSLIVKDSYDEILKKIVIYRKQIGCFKNEE